MTPIPRAPLSGSPWLCGNNLFPLSDFYLEKCSAVGMLVSRLTYLIIVQKLFSALIQIAVLASIDLLKIFQFPEVIFFLFSGTPEIPL